MTGTGGGGSGFAAAGPCAKCCHPRYPPEATASITRPTSRGGRRPLLTAGLSEATNGAAIGSYFLIDCGPAERCRLTREWDRRHDELADDVSTMRRGYSSVPPHTVISGGCSCTCGRLTPVVG